MCFILHKPVVNVNIISYFYDTNHIIVSIFYLLHEIYDI